jgi:tRNA pseudouridine55 synthase
VARAGGTVELREREVTIDALTLVSWDDAEADRPFAVVDVVCSAGTYVRALARDLGERVGSAAYLGALRRTAARPFTEVDALTLDAVRAAAADGQATLAALLHPIDSGLERFPAIDLSDAEVAAVARGQFVRPAAGIPARADRFRLRAPDGTLVAIAVPADGGRLTPDKVLVPAPERVTSGAGA